MSCSLISFKIVLPLRLLFVKLLILIKTIMWPTVCDTKVWFVWVKIFYIFFNLDKIKNINQQKTNLFR